MLGTGCWGGATPASSIQHPGPGLESLTRALLGRNLPRATVVHSSPQPDPDSNAPPDRAASDAAADGRHAWRAFRPGQAAPGDLHRPGRRRGHAAVFSRSAGRSHALPFRPARHRQHQPPGRGRDRARDPADPHQHQEFPRRQRLGDGPGGALPGDAGRHRGVEPDELGVRDLFSGTQAGPQRHGRLGAGAGCAGGDRVHGHGALSATVPAAPAPAPSLATATVKTSIVGVVLMAVVVVLVQLIEPLRAGKFYPVGATLAGGVTGYLFARAARASSTLGQLKGGALCAALAGGLGTLAAALLGQLPLQNVIIAAITNAVAGSLGALAGLLHLRVSGKRQAASR